MLLYRVLTESLKISSSNIPSAEVSSPSTTLLQRTALTSLPTALQHRNSLHSCKVLTSQPTQLGRSHISQIVIQTPVIKHQLSSRTAATPEVMMCMNPPRVACTVPHTKLHPLRAGYFRGLEMQLIQVNNNLSLSLKQSMQVIRACQITTCSQHVRGKTVWKGHSQSSCLLLLSALQVGMILLSRCVH